MKMISKESYKDLVNILFDENLNDKQIIIEIIEYITIYRVKEACECL